jgi:hypothetical protein
MYYWRLPAVTLELILQDNSDICRILNLWISFKKEQLDITV